VNAFAIQHPTLNYWLCIETLGVESWTLGVSVRYENRTSLPGSISKSSPSESSVFGLITSSMNFT